MTTAVSWMLRATINNGASDDFRSLMDEMVESAGGEPGTTNYEWFIDGSESSFHIYERYADSDAAMTHIETFGAKFAERFMSLVEISEMTVYGEPSDDVRQALAGLDSNFYGILGGFSR